MNESFGAGGFDVTNTPGSGVQSEAKAEGIAPVVIKQITSSPESGFKLFGMSFGMINLVAIVRAIEHSSTKVTFTLEDYTGQIDAHLWLEEGESGTLPTLLLNTYARVYGAIRNQGGAKAIMIFKIEPVASINELTTHLLEVLNARYSAEEFSKLSGSIGSGMANQNPNIDFSSNAAMGNNDANGAANALKGKHLLIFEAVKNSTSDQGISLQELQKKFIHISASELLSITEFMTQEGHIYTSIDAEHFLPTDI